jgi:ADP-heptose:LPS heptosyltransferase
LKTTFQRYADVFEKLGLSVQLDVKQGILHPHPNRGLLPGKKKTGLLIGIAPFARHAAKMYPLEKMKETVQLLSLQDNVTILLFGSPGEAKTLEEWEKNMTGVYSLAGKMNFSGELNVIAQLDVMVSMDSANMHLASLYGIPVVSVWGGTHPFLGFYGWGQPMENAIQSNLPCRPSSVFGNKECPVHGKQGCMMIITPEMIADRVKEICGLQPSSRQILRN